MSQFNPEQEQQIQLAVAVISGDKELVLPELAKVYNIKGVTPDYLLSGVKGDAPKGIAYAAYALHKYPQMGVASIMKRTTLIGKNAQYLDFSASADKFLDSLDDFESEANFKKAKDKEVKAENGTALTKALNSVLSALEPVEVNVSFGVLASHERQYAEILTRIAALRGQFGYRNTPVVVTQQEEVAEVIA